MGTTSTVREAQAKLEALAWSIMIVSVFRQSERQTLNLLISIVGVSVPNETSQFLDHIFRLVRKGIIYIPEARLETLYEAPECVDVYLMKDFDETMKELVRELNQLRIKVANIEHLTRIPQKVLIDLKNYTAGKYVEAFHSMDS